MNRYVVGIHTLFKTKLRLFDIRAETEFDAAREAISQLVDDQRKGTWTPDELAEIAALETFEELVEYMNEDAIEILELE